MYLCYRGGLYWYICVLQQWLLAMYDIFCVTGMEATTKGAAVCVDPVTALCSTCIGISVLEVVRRSPCLQHEHSATETWWQRFNPQFFCLDGFTINHITVLSYHCLVNTGCKCSCSWHKPSATETWWQRLNQQFLCPNGCTINHITTLSYHCLALPLANVAVKNSGKRDL